MAFCGFFAGLLSISSWNAQAKQFHIYTSNAILLYAYFAFDNAVFSIVILT